MRRFLSSRPRLAHVALAVALVGVGVLATPFAQTAEAAKPAKAKVCHYSKDDEAFELKSVPLSQFEPKTNRKGRTQPLRGHGKHEFDVRVGDDATQAICDALTPPAVEETAEE